VASADSLHKTGEFRALVLPVPSKTQGSSAVQKRMAVQAIASPRDFVFSISCSSPEWFRGSPSLEMLETELRSAELDPSAGE